MRVSGIGKAFAAANALFFGLFLVGPPDVVAQEAKAPADRWGLSCRGVDSARTCALRQTIHVQKGDKRERLFAINIRRTADGTERLTLGLPHGLHLPGGVSLKIDDQQLREFTIATSNATGVYAFASVGAELREALAVGKIAEFGLTRANRTRLNIQIDLTGAKEKFAALAQEVGKR